VHPEAKRRGKLGQGRSGAGEPELKPWCHQWDSRFAGGELSCSSANRSVGSVSLRRSGATIQAKRIDHGESKVLRLKRGLDVRGRGSAHELEVADDGFLARWVRGARPGLVGSWFAA
jgi:hypothetical protein